MPDEIIPPSLSVTSGGGDPTAMSIAFHLLGQMDAKITGRFDRIENKLDSKADKDDLLRLEARLDSQQEQLSVIKHKQDTETEYRDVKHRAREVWAWVLGAILTMILAATAIINSFKLVH